MSSPRSRREFLTASALTGLALPAAAHASIDTPKPAPPAMAPAPAPAAPVIRKRKLGKTGMEVSEVAFGCMITSDQSVIERAADLGVNLFDTARGYQGGNNERLVGAALKGRRDKVFISTKSGGKTKEEALAHLDESLKQLDTDHVDIWYLHGKKAAAEITDELLDAQRVAKEQGKIRFAGVSLHAGHEEVIPAAIEKKMDVVLVTYNFTMADRNDALMNSLHDAGVGVVAMKVMAGGRGPEAVAMREKLAARGGMISALKWVLRNPSVDTTIPSTTDMAQLDENLRAMAEPWAPADEQKLVARLEQIRPDYCSMCGQCEGTCPKGLPVADVLRYLTYAEGYGQFGLGREHFLALPAAQRDVRCGDCAECAVRCPQGVEVARRLTRAQTLFA
ncbi:MAG TPA: aldo/keto reductase [Vicinamibacteria bacterium]|nr:aldo/keto reductase [Vicinamibacteria bacterium]